ncbi:MAG: hypothetical protein ACI30K_01560 [Muribaculaceae bacterium]
MATTDVVSKLIADLRAVTAPRAITPAGIARILEEITKLTAGTADAAVVAQLQAAIAAARAAADAAKDAADTAAADATAAADKADAATAAAKEAVVEARNAANSASVQAANAANLANEAKAAATAAIDAASSQAEDLKQYIGIYEIKAFTYHPKEYTDALPGDAVWAAADMRFYTYDASAADWTTNNVLNARDSIGNIVSPAFDKLFRLENVLYRAIDDGVGYALTPLASMRDVNTAKTEAIATAKQSRGIINLHTEFYDEVGPITRAIDFFEAARLLDSHSPNGEYHIPGIIIIYNDKDAGGVVALAWKLTEIAGQDDWYDMDNWQVLWR